MLDAPPDRRFQQLGIRSTRPVSAVAATCGAGGRISGAAVPRPLTLPLVDRAIPAALAAKLHEPLAAALADDTERGTAVGRLLRSALNHSGLFAGIPVPDEERGVLPDIAMSETAIRRLAAGGRAVILGRAGVFVLKHRPDVLHVR